MLEILKLIVAASFGYLLVGYVTPKFTVYGGIATIAIWFCYLILPGPEFRASEVASTMIPRFIDLWTLYPRVVGMVVSRGEAEYGELGVILYGGVVLSMALPYMVGIYFGCVTWPELVVLRIL